MSALTMASAALRLGIGLTIFLAGLEKVARGPEYTTAYFGAVGVPFPGATAPLVTGFELVAGLCLVAGAATAVVAALVGLEMLGIILLVRLPQAGSTVSFIDSFLALRLELVVALSATAIALLGPGEWSIDRLVAARRKGPSSRDD